MKVISILPQNASMPDRDRSRNCGRIRNSKAEYSCDVFTAAQI